MRKKEQTMFSGEIEIPEAVQKKADLAFSQIKNERVGNMEQPITNKKGKNIKRACAAFAACAVFAAAFGWYAMQPVGERNMDACRAEESAVENAAVIRKPVTLSAGTSENGERIELEKGKPAVVAAGDADSWVLGCDEQGVSGYCINLPFTCEGENIDSVTYSINRGVFQVVERKGTSIIKSGKKAQETPDGGQIGGGYDEATGENMPVTLSYYTEYTLDYGLQESDVTWINMVRDGIRLSDKDLIWGESRTKEDVKQGFDELFGDVTITCTVHFTDDTSETIEIEPGVLVTTRTENGEQCADAVLTFERK